MSEHLTTADLTAGARLAMRGRGAYSTATKLIVATVAGCWPKAPTINGLADWVDLTPATLRRRDYLQHLTGVELVEVEGNVVQPGRVLLELAEFARQDRLRREADAGRE